jgi:hypothetical protein
MSTECSLEANHIREVEVIYDQLKLAQKAVRSILDELVEVQRQLSNHLLGLERP